jgi:hypothetical protein
MNKGTIARSSDPAVGCRNKLCQPEEHGPAGPCDRAAESGKKKTIGGTPRSHCFTVEEVKDFGRLSFGTRGKLRFKSLAEVFSSHQVQNSCDNVRGHAMAHFILVMTPIGSTVPHGSHDKVGINKSDIERFRQSSQDRIVTIHHHGRTPIGGWTRRNKTTEWVVIHRS